MRFNREFLVLLLLSLAACGGGGGGGSSSETPAETTADATDTEITEDNHDPLAGGFPLILTAPDNNASLTSCTADVDPAPGSTITGIVRYERVPLGFVGLDYSARQWLPVRGVVVEAVGVDSGQCTDTVLARTLTDKDGQYGVNVNPSTPVCIQVRAQMYRGAGAGANWDFQVTDNTQGNAPYYLLGSSKVAANALNYREINAGSGWNAVLSRYSDTRAAAPFAILDSLCDALDTVITADPSASLPSLYLRWSTNNIALDGDLAAGEVGTPFYRKVIYVDGNGNELFDVDEIFLLGDEDSNTDEYDPHVIIHESGHFITSNLSRSDSYGGGHALGDRLDMTVAFDEGFADALAGIVLDGKTSLPYMFQDTIGFNQSQAFRFNLSVNNSGAKGWYSESSVYKIIYNLFDSINNGIDDNLSLSFKQIHDANVAQSNTEAMVSIFSFINKLKQQNSGVAGLIDLQVSDQAIESSLIDDFGSNESATNNDFAVASAADVMPVYTALPVSSTQRVCSNNQFGLMNKLSVIQYMKLDIAVPRQYVITVSSADGLGEGVVELYKQGDLQGVIQAAGKGALFSGAFNLQAGTYILAVFDKENINEESESPGRYCFDVRVD